MNEAAGQHYRNGRRPIFISIGSQGGATMSTIHTGILLAGGGAVCGCLIGILGGGIIAAVYGAFFGSVALGFGGALIGGLLGIVGGAIYGTILWLSDLRSTPPTIGRGAIAAPNSTTDKTDSFSLELDEMISGGPRHLQRL